MVEVTATNIERHIMGDLVLVTADLATVTDNYTFTVPHISKILDYNFNTTVDDSHGGTISANVITFKIGDARSGRISVWGK